MSSDTPLGEKPTISLEVSSGATVREVVEVAFDRWGITLGPEGLKYHSTGVSEVSRFAFVREERDLDGVDDQERYDWPATLPIARASGEIEDTPGLEVTFPELIVSSALGLIEGDVTRPYIDPVMPQGELEVWANLAQVTVEMIRAAYAAVDDAYGYTDRTIRIVEASTAEPVDTAKKVLDDAGRIMLVYEAVRRIRDRF